MHIVHVMYCVLYTWHKVKRVQQAQVKGRVREYKQHQHQQQCNKPRHFYQIFAFMLAVIFLLLLIFILRTWMPRQWLSYCWMADWLGVCMYVCMLSFFLKSIFAFFHSMSSLGKWLLNKVQVMCVQNVIVREMASLLLNTFFWRCSYHTSNSRELLNDYFPFWCV